MKNDRQTNSERDSDGENDVPECGHRDCTDDAVAIYEGSWPGRPVRRFPSCNSCAPDIPPVRWIGDRLMTDGGSNGEVMVCE